MFCSVLWLKWWVWSRVFIWVISGWKLVLIFCVFVFLLGDFRMIELVVVKVSKVIVSFRLMCFICVFWCVFGLKLFVEMFVGYLVRCIWFELWFRIFVIVIWFYVICIWFMFYWWGLGVGFGRSVLYYIDYYYCVICVVCDVFCF